MGNKGTEFEKEAKLFLEELFKAMEYQIIELRVQHAGTQNGFDILVQFIDDYQFERNIHFECKNYATDLKWAQIATKVLELGGSNFEPDAFIAISPQRDISNISRSTINDLEKRYGFPIKIWSPGTNIKRYFSLSPSVSQRVFGNTLSLNATEKQSLIQSMKAYFENLLAKKRTLKILSKIEIKKSSQKPKNDELQTTTLDQKLNLIFDENDPDRLEYHQLRCDYKIYLEELEDLNNSLRSRILKWQENLTLKAKRLTRKFAIMPNYSPSLFFFDFFDIAEKQLLSFFEVNQLHGDSEKLLHGVVFEIASKCHLNWTPRESNAA